MKKSLYKHKPIIFQWVKQYLDQDQKVCDLCRSTPHGKQQLATHQIEVYLDFLQLLQQQPSGIIDLERLDKQMWRTLTQEQMEDLPQIKRVDYNCKMHAAFQMNAFLDTNGAAERVLDIPRLNKGHPIASVISWVLFKRASDPDQPLMIFTESSNTIEQVVDQAEDVLRSGKLTSAQDFPKGFA